MNSQMNIATHKNSYLAACLKTLKQEGFRITEARRLIIDALSASHSPLSPKELAEQIFISQPEHPIDLVSIYRTLETFLSLQLVHKISPEGVYVACRHLNCHHEIHVLVRCRKCPRIEEIDVPLQVMGPLLDHLEKQKSFTAERHLVQVNGECHACA